MLQYSVYIRTCPSREFAERVEKRLQKIVPESGNVRTLIITEKQYEDMKIMVGTRKYQEDAYSTERILYL